MDYDKIGKFILERRKDLGLTQNELAFKLNVTNKAVSKWERGLGCPDVSLLGELSEILGVGIGELLNGEYNEELKNNNDFIMNAVNHTKKETQNKIFLIIYKIIILFIILISAYFVFMDVKQINFLNKYDEYNFTEENMKSINEKYNELKNKVNVVLKMNNNFSEHDLYILKKLSTFILLSIDETKLLEYKGDVKIYYSEFNVINKNNDFRINYISNLIFEVLLNYKPGLDSLHDIFKYTYEYDYDFEDILDDGHLRNIYLYSYIDKLNYSISDNIKKLDISISKLLIIYDNLIEVGEINE